MRPVWAPSLTTVPPETHACPGEAGPQLDPRPMDTAAGPGSLVGEGGPKHGGPAAPAPMFLARLLG